MTEEGRDWQWDSGSGSGQDPEMICYASSSGDGEITQETYLVNSRSRLTGWDERVTRRMVQTTTTSWERNTPEVVVPEFRRR